MSGQKLSVKLILILFFLFFITQANSDSFSGVNLSATRIIYPLEGKGASVTVTNNQGYPVLVKSEVMNESQEEAPFYVTPPLFRLDSGQRNAMSIIRTGGNYPSDRESINWFCVRGIPPETDSVWTDTPEKSADASKGNVSVGFQVVVSSCIKMFVRPEKLKGNSADMADKVLWKIVGGNLIASNPTPFYINIAGATFNGAEINIGKGYIPPFSEEKAKLSSGFVSEKGTLKWKIIGDYGERKEQTTLIN
ncbi:molecular chaperone [Salmonella enterica subsp. enterica serovar Infantis]|nr:molecular chaperone [Salmonella enterica subsp. enterica serovar Infantis]